MRFWCYKLGITDDFFFIIMLRSLTLGDCRPALKPPWRYYYALKAQRLHSESGHVNRFIPGSEATHGSPAPLRERGPSFQKCHLWTVRISEQIGCDFMDWSGWLENFNGYLKPRGNPFFSTIINQVLYGVEQRFQGEKKTAKQHLRRLRIFLRYDWTLKDHVQTLSAN